MNTQVRIGHYSPDAPAVNVLVDDDHIIENVSFGELTEYFNTDPGSHEIEVVTATQGDSIFHANLDLENDTDYTVLAIGDATSVRPLVLVDENRSVQDRTQVRLVHTSPDAPAVDARVVDDDGEGPTLFRNVAFGEASDYIGVDAATYDIDLMPTGSDRPALSLSDVSLEGGGTVTIVATGMLDDDTLDAQLVADYDAHDAPTTGRH